MGFAEGFAAGSAAVSRGVDMAEKARRMQREYEQEQGIKALEQERISAQQMADSQANVEQTASAQGIGLMSPVGQPQSALAAALPQTPQGLQSAAVPQQTALQSALGVPQSMAVDQASAPQPMSDRDYNRRLAGILRSTGDMAGAQALESEQRRSDQFTQQLEAQDRQFTTRMEEMIRSNKASEEDRDNTLQFYSDQLADTAKKTAATVNKLNEEVNTLRNNRNTSDATLQGEAIYSDMVMNGSTLNDVKDRLSSMYEPGSLQHSAAVKAATSKYLSNNGVNEETVGAVSKRMVAPVAEVLSLKFDTPEKEYNAWNKALAEFADPDFTDKEQPKLVPVMKKTGLGGKEEPTGQYKLTYRGGTLKDFASLDDVRAYAQEEMGAMKSDPTRMVEFIDKEKRQLTASLAAAKSAQEREKLFFSFVEKNPYLVQDPEEEQRYRKMYNIDSALPAPGWDTDNTPKTPSGPFQSTRMEEQRRIEEQQTEEERIGLGQQRYKGYTPDFVQGVTSLNDLYAVTSDKYAPADIRDAARLRIADLVNARANEFGL